MFAIKQKAPLEQARESLASLTATRGQFERIKEAIANVIGSIFDRQPTAKASAERLHGQLDEGAVSAKSGSVAPTIISTASNLLSVVTGVMHKVSLLSQSALRPAINLAHSKVQERLSLIVDMMESQGFNVENQKKNLAAYAIIGAAQSDVSFGSFATQHRKVFDNYRQIATELGKIAVGRDSVNGRSVSGIHTEVTDSGALALVVETQRSKEKA